MKVKNRLKHRYVLLALSAVLFLFGATNVSALTKNITVTDAAIKDKSGTVAVEEPVLSDNKITSNVTFNQKDDFVAFELLIKNGESEKYKIESIEDNNTNNNIQIDYSYGEDFIDTNSTGTIAIKLSYKSTLINVAKVSINDLTIKIHLVSEDGKSEDVIINPNTGDTLPFYLTILAIAVIVLAILFRKKKVAAVKIGGVLVALSLFLIPLMTLASEKYEIQVKFTNIDIIGEFETYNITINPGNGSEIIVVPVKYGNKLESLPADPSKDGYDFDKWVDGDGNEVTTDTVVTGPMTVEAKYTIKEYNINYNLNGGSLPSDKTNPDKYTILDEVTVNNPEKQGYTFTGWSGTGIDGKTTNLVIPAGSKDERSYVANYSANENTPYTVTHRYQNLDDLTTYTESTVTEYGETDKTIPAPRQEKTGFATPAVQNVTVNADGSASVTYTYDRETYLYSVTDRIYITDDSTANGSYPYETSITVKAQERAGYTFAWNDGDTNYERTFELTGAVSLTPVYTAKTNTKYVVKHYKQKLTLDGYEIADTQNLTGTTDAPISPAVNTYTGFKSPAVQHTTIAGDGSTEVIYNYDREMFAFSFNDNANVTSSKPADSYPYETVITLTANEVAGKTFSKWSNDATDNPLTITLTGDLTIEPVYTDSTVTVTFDTNGGSEVASQYVLPGGKATRPAEDPTKFNQLFYNWYTTDSYETLFDFNTTTITADTTVYARFVPSSFPTVFEQEGECIFNGSEGVLEGESCAYANGENKFINTGVQLYTAENHDKDYEIGFTIKSYDYLENVTQATFMNTKLEGNNYPGLVFRQFDDEDELDFSARKTETYNVRKKWANEDKERVVKIYRIRNKTTKVQEIFYSMDGGKKTQLTNLSHFNPVFDTSVWFGAAPVDTSANTAQRILVGTLSNMYIKLGAYEEPEGVTYTVKFDANGGSVSPSSITKDKGDAIDELPTPTDIPAGKTFGGWYTDLGEEGVKVESPYMPNTNKTLYAKYKDIQYAVTFDTDGGSEVASQTITYGGKVTRPSDPTRSKYTFYGWYTDNTYTTVFDFENSVITDDTIIYANWKALAILGPGTTVNRKMKKLAGNSSATHTSTDTVIKTIQRSSTKPDLTQMTDDNIVSDDVSLVPIYMWFDNDIIYWWSDNDIITLRYYSGHYLFHGFSGIEHLDLTNFDTKDVSDMSWMFCNMKNLTTLILGDKFDTSKVTDMSWMFGSTNKLIALDLGEKFDTSNVTNMANMFQGMYDLISLKLGDKFDTSKVTSMSWMFSVMSSITTLVLGDKFDTSKVKNMESMFQQDDNLVSLDLGNNFNTSNATRMQGMFKSCSSLTTLNLGEKFDTSNVAKMNSMFYGCSSLTTLNLGEKFDTSLVTDMNHMFSNCPLLEMIVVNDLFVTTNASFSNDMFTGSTSLIGGKGTMFDSSHTDKAYAHIDGGTDDPGYFTDIEDVNN